MILDAAQSLGQVAVATALAPAWGADVVVAPAHKWLHGMAGVAILWARAGVEIEPFVWGGTGSASDSLAMPGGFTERLEAGTPDLPALAALAAAAAWIEAETVTAIHERCGGLAAACAERLRKIRGARVFSAPDAGPPIVSLTLDGYDPSELAALLEHSVGVQARSGYHCAACVHEWLGTQAGGTVRLAFGPFNTAADVDAVEEAVGQIAA